MKKVCIVTGGSAGIGQACVKRLLADGYLVFNFDISAGTQTEFVSCDISDKQQVEAAVAQVMQQTKRIDLVVSNAGIHQSATIEQTTDSDFEHVMNINVKGAFYLLRAVLPIMREQRTGNIVLVASDQSLIAKPNSFVYNLSKHALASMAKTTALDYASYGIRANAVCPGTIATPLYSQAIEKYCHKNNLEPEQVHAEEAAMQPIGRIGKPEEVAALVAFLASNEAGFITGSLQVIDGGYTAA